MPALASQLEQKFTEVLTSRAAAAPRGATGASDPQPSGRPEQDGRSSPRGHRRDLSQDTERLLRRPGVLRQQLELHHEAQPGGRAKSPRRRTENGPGRPPADAIRRGTSMHPSLFAAAIAAFVIVARLVALE